MNTRDIREKLTEIIDQIDTIDLRKAKTIINAVDKMLISAKDEKKYFIDKKIYGQVIPIMDFYENDTDYLE